MTPSYRRNNLGPEIAPATVQITIMPYQIGRKTGWPRPERSRARAFGLLLGLGKLRVVGEQRDSQLRGFRFLRLQLGRGRLPRLLAFGRDQLVVVALKLMDSPCHRSVIGAAGFKIIRARLRCRRSSMSTCGSSFSGLTDGFPRNSHHRHVDVPRPACARTSRPFIVEGMIPKSPTPIMTASGVGVFSRHPAQQRPFNRIPPTKLADECRESTEVHDYF